jgi:uncharacterized protein YggE
MSTLSRLKTIGGVGLGLALVAALLGGGALIGAGGRSGAAPGAGLGPLVPGAVYAQGVIAPGGQGDGQTGIVVQGEGVAMAAPDVAILNLAVQTEAPTAREALDKNSAAMAGVIEALKRIGIPEKDLQTSGLQISEVRARQRPNDETPPPIVGYRVQNGLNVTVEPVVKAGEALDVAVSAGANASGGVRFTLKDDSALRRQALEEAARAARTKAEALAGALGLRLGSIRAVVEESGGAIPVARAEVMSFAAADTAPPIQPGELTLRVRVRVIFNLA